MAFGHYSCSSADHKIESNRFAEKEAGVCVLAMLYNTYILIFISGRARPSCMNESMQHHILGFSFQFCLRLADLACMRELTPHIVASHHRVHAVGGLKWQVTH